jgi:hypothetical protein
MSGGLYGTMRGGVEFVMDEEGGEGMGPEFGRV